ncbi:hypothetical protein BH10ACT1_BH10ACT1_18180 [soil metagenome]
MAHAVDTDQRLFSCQELSTLDREWEAHAHLAAGAVVVRVGAGERWLVWFRAEAASVIRWGGDPNGKEATVGLRGQLQLNPRASFAEYLEHVRGTSRPWTREQLAVARSAADRLAALDAVKAQRDATVALQLQRAVMIEAFPPTPGIDGAARYEPSARDPIGGDWYDVFFRHQGGPVIALGDVAGHGLTAAATMAQLRHALRAYAIREDTSAEAMSRLNELMLTLLPKKMATAMIVSLDLASATADIVNAGHLPAVVVGPAGARLVEDSRHDPALGVVRGARYKPTRVHLPAGHTLLLFTDGLIERRSASIDERLVSLLDAAAAGAHLSTGALCDHLLATLGGDSDVDDDTTVLAVRFTEA